MGVEIRKIWGGGDRDRESRPNTKNRNGERDKEIRAGE